MPAETMFPMATNWKSFRESIDKITNLINYYEVKEATSLFELALWKATMEQANRPTREACRIEVPGPVKETILQYL